MKYALQSYSIQAGVYLASNVAFSQVIYTDLDPDVYLETHGAYFEIDLNNDAVADYGLIRVSVDIYSFSLGSYLNYNEILIGPLNPSNQIAGELAYTGGFGASGLFSWYLPYAIKFNISINSELSWQNDNLQPLAVNVEFEHGGSSFFNCNWANNSLSDYGDAYLGLRFYDELNQLHYGWIRCEVKNEAPTLIIKDYAYQATPKTSILAGQMPDLIGGGGVVSIDNESQTFPTSIYAFGKTIHIHSKPDEYNNAVVLNMQGQLVYQQAITNKYTEIILTTVPPGMYQVILQSNQGAYSAKVMMVD